MDRPLAHYIPGFKGYSHGGLEMVNRWLGDRLDELAASPLLRIASHDPAASSTADIIAGLLNRLAEEVRSMGGSPVDEERLEKLDTRIARLLLHLGSMVERAGQASSPVLLREYLKMVLEVVLRIRELVGERRPLLSG